MPEVQRAGCRFVASMTPDGKPALWLELFHNTVPVLSDLHIGFEVLSGTTVNQAKQLAEAINERVLGIVVTGRAT